MQLHTDVCIIGNGIIGKTAALGLAQAGLRVALLCAEGPQKSAPPAGWDVRVYALNHVAHGLLSSLKVWDALDAARIAPVEAMHVHGDGMAQSHGLHFDAYGARVTALAWIVEDANLNQALDAALKFSSNIQVLSARAVRMQANPAQAQVQLDDGSALHASLLVGADGAHSWLRHQCGIGMDYRSYGQRGVVANFSCEKPHHGVAHQWFAGAQGIVALLPLPDKKVSLVWSAPDALADTLLSGSLSQMAERLSVFAAERLGRLLPLQPEVAKAFPLALIRPHAITAPRVALIGDAAHVVHPLAGHGMNLGFADVAALIKQIERREPQRDCGDARILGRYARVRKEDILLMQLATDGLARLFAYDVEPLRRVRNLGLNLVDHLPGIKRRLITHALGKQS